MVDSPDSVASRFLRGDVEAHGQVYRWVAQILSLGRFRLIRDEWADLTQEILGRIVESIRSGRFDSSRDFRAYVHSIARYTARDTLVARLGRPSVPISELDNRDDPEQVIAVRDFARTALEQASIACRELFDLVFFEQRSYADIARQLDVPVGTVKSRVFRCLQAARARMLKAGRS